MQWGTVAGADGKSSAKTSYAVEIAYVKKNLGHYIKNTGDTDLQVLEVFKAPQFQDVSLSDWITHTPPALVAQHFNVSPDTIAKLPRSKPEIVPV